MNPLDALSSLTQLKIPTSGVNFQPTGPSVPGGAISESFKNQLQPLENQIQPLQNQLQLMQIPQVSTPAASIGSAGGASTWGHLVQQMVMDVNSKQQTAAQKVSDVLQGGPTPVHEAMAATEEASLSFEFLAEMRNKVVEAYQQVMQMQV
jgi:flagellar hook-basal body complex protein FliE